jgi:hypothetical protein
MQITDITYKQPHTIAAAIREELNGGGANLGTVGEATIAQVMGQELLKLRVEKGERE